MISCTPATAGLLWTGLSSWCTKRVSSR